MTTITPAAGLALIRRIQTAETYASSQIIIPEQARDKVAACQFEVVRVGAPEPCDDEDCERAHHKILRFRDGKQQDDWLAHPCDLKPGDWVLVRKRSEVQTPNPELFVVRQADVIGRFREVEAPGAPQATTRPQRRRSLTLAGACLLSEYGH